MLEPPTIAEIRLAARGLAEVIVPTPLVPLAGHERERDVLLKLEMLQPVGSFKIRGVFHAASTLEPAERARGLVTVSAGNTAQALCWTARRFGVPARCVMPDTAPANKVAAVRRLGGQPVLVSREELFAYLRERRWEGEAGAFVHPWTSRDLMIGHGTLGPEILAAAPDVRTVYVPVGGGGLLGGVGTALKALAPGVRVVAVEPEGCAALAESLRLGRPASVNCRTMCDGVAVPYVTEEVFALARQIVDETLRVGEREVRRAIRRLALANRVVAEGAAALALAAALVEPPERRGRAVCLVTGGSIDAEVLSEILNDATLGEAEGEGET